MEKLESKEKLYRIYVGPGKNYRSIFQILDEVLLVLVVKVGDRKEVYRRLRFWGVVDGHSSIRSPARKYAGLAKSDHPVLFDMYGKLPYSLAMDKEITTARLEARLPADVHALLKRAAEMQGRSLTDFVVTAARDAAVKTIEIGEIIRLSVGDQRRIADALLTPPEPTVALRRAFERRNRLLGPA